LPNSSFITSISFQNTPCANPVPNALEHASLAANLLAKFEALLPLDFAYAISPSVKIRLHKPSVKSVNRFFYTPNIR
jgi:hypothetical protein